MWHSSKRSDSARSRRTAILAGSVVLGLGLGACAPSLSLVTVSEDEPRVEISSTVFGRKNVKTQQTPVINIDQGRIESVAVTTANGGERVGGSLANDGTAWEIDPSSLEFGTKYKVTTNAVDLRGNQTSHSGTFKTFTPEKELTIITNVNDGSTYGVGMPITVSFNEPVKNRADIESRLEVTTDAKEQAVGRWSWDSDTLVTYRPKKYWPGHTKVTLNARLKGAHAGNDVYGMENSTRNFTLGSRNIMLVDADAHDMTFRRDGKLVKTMPVSTGKLGYETRSGIKVIISKERNVKFTADVAESDPEYYNLDIAVAMRVTWSGEYLHSAPWSVGSQGNTNVSHGCVNLSPSNAEWVIQNTNIGDIVEVVNTNRVQDLGNGITVWNESWKDWVAGSAL